jgi:hypothetical protein
LALRRWLPPIADRYGTEFDLISLSLSLPLSLGKSLPTWEGEGGESGRAIRAMEISGENKNVSSAADVRMVHGNVSFQLSASACCGNAGKERLQRHRDDNVAKTLARRLTATGVSIRIKSRLSSRALVGRSKSLATKARIAFLY